MHRWKVTKIINSIRIRIKTKPESLWSSERTEPRKHNNLRKHETEIWTGLNGSQKPT